MITGAKVLFLFRFNTDKVLNVCKKMVRRFGGGWELFRYKSGLTIALGHKSSKTT
jgi:hypothetical protein